jgi:NAD+ diphosphatase
LESNPDAWHGLRKTGAGLSARDAGLYAEGLALANWHASHLYCPRCGQATETTQSGWVRVCPVDGHQIFPRTDPAIIVSVIDDQDRILLGSQGIWEENRWSILAGFVEPGESLAAAVQREVFEESGVRVIAPEYLGSQAWPFPYSLMVGFTAKVDPKHAGEALVPDGEEIEKLRWFSREEIAAEASSLLLPGTLSIAGALIEHWYGGPIGS